jgi:hypothetical protein
MDWQLPYATVQNLYSQAYMKQPKSGELFDVVAHTGCDATSPESSVEVYPSESVYNNSPPQTGFHLSSAPPVPANMQQWDAQEQPVVSYLNMFPHTVTGLTLHGIFDMGVSNEARDAGLYERAMFKIKFMSPFQFTWTDSAHPDDAQKIGTYAYQRAYNNKYAILVLTFTNGYQLNAELRAKVMLGGEMLSTLGIASFQLQPDAAVQ